MKWGSYIVILKNGLHITSSYGVETLKEFMEDVQEQFHNYIDDIYEILVSFDKESYQIDTEKLENFFNSYSYNLDEFCITFPEKEVE